MKEVYLSQLRKKYRIIYLHNPKHFFLNRLWIENLDDGRKIVCANPRPHSKQFHHLALLKPLHVGVGSSKEPNRTKKFVVDNTKKLEKPFNGIFTDSE